MTLATVGRGLVSPILSRCAGTSIILEVIVRRLLSVHTVHRGEEFVAEGGVDNQTNEPIIDKNHL